MKKPKLLGNVIGLVLAVVLIGAMLPLGALATHSQVEASPPDLSPSLTWESDDIGSVMSMALDDVDGDGISEIICGTLTSFDEGTYTYHGYIYIFNALTHELEWKSNDIGHVTDVIATDLDDDGNCEILAQTRFGRSSIIGDCYGYVYVFDGASHEQIWKSTNIGEPGDLTAADLDGDGVEEIIAGAMDYYSCDRRGHLYVFDGAEFDQEWQSPDIDCPTVILVADLDDDGVMEIVSGACVTDCAYSGGEGGWYYPGYVYVFDGISFAQEWQSGDIGSATSLDITDVDDDGTMELIVGIHRASEPNVERDRGYIYVFDGTTHSQEWRSSNIDTPYGMTVDDINNDGTKEITARTAQPHTAAINAGHIGHLYVFDGKTHDQWESDNLGDAYCLEVSDIDDDGTAEILTKILSDSGWYLGIWNGGTHDQEWQSTDDVGSLGPDVMIPYVNGQGDSEILVAGGDPPSPGGVYHGHLYVFGENSEDTTPPIVDDFLADKTSIHLGDTIRFSYSVSDTGGSGLKQVELWEAADTDGDGQPNWPTGQTDYVDMQTISGDTPPDHFDYEPQELGTHWYGIHVVDNDGNWNDERNTRSGGLPGVFGPLQIDTTGIVVTQPNGGDSWAMGSPRSITWVSFGVIGNVDISLSRDGGSSWQGIASNIANYGTLTRSATGPQTNQALVKVASSWAPSIYDVSDMVFSIVTPPNQSGPTIRTFSPHEDYAGKDVHIVGTNFVADGTDVVFGEIEADEDAIDWSRSTSTEIFVTVPNGPEAAMTGRITVKTSEGTTVSADEFVAKIPDQPWGTQIGIYNGVPAYSNGAWWTYRYDAEGNKETSGYGYAYQCVEYVKRYYAVALHHPIPGAGNASTYYYNAYAIHQLHPFPNGGDDPPRVDDILVFYSSKLPLGHVAIVTNVVKDSKGNLREIEIIQQNVVSPFKSGANYRATATLKVTTSEDGTYWVHSEGSGLATPIVGWSRIPETP